MRFFFLDSISFWIGFAAATFFWWFYRQLRPFIKDFRGAMGQRVQRVRVGLSTSIEQRYRMDVLRMAQGNHIAAPLFALDEIAVPHHLLTPPPLILPGGDIPIQDVVANAVPYMPDWPELASAYGASMLTLPEALVQGANLLVVGMPGSGKTFALSHFASQIARRERSLGDLANMVPVLVHAAELSLPAKSNNLLDVIYRALYDRVSTLVEAQLPDLLETIFTRKLTILMVDGLDELTSEMHAPIIEYLDALMQEYPGNRLIVAASPEDISCMEPLSLHPLPLAAWGPRQAIAFIQKWAELWDQFVAKEAWAQSLPRKMDSVLLNGWLLKDSAASNPLMLTLKIWSAYAGDALGPTPADALEAYLRRMTVGVTNARPAMEQLAVQMLVSLSPILERRTAGRYVASFEAEDGAEPPGKRGRQEPAIDVEELNAAIADLDAFLEEQGQRPAPAPLQPFIEEADDSEQVAGAALTTGAGKVGAGTVRRMLPEMVSSHILAYRPESRITFAHPVVGAYLAGCGLARRGEVQQTLAQPDWPAKFLAWEFLASRGDAQRIAHALLDSNQDDALQKRLLHLSRWPRSAPKNAPWRAAVLRTLANELQKESLSLGLRARIIAGLALSGEPGILNLFKQLLASAQPSLRHLGALGMGFLQDESAIEDLNSLLYDPERTVSQAACLALVAINTTQSIEMVATAMLQGAEDVRRAAAEALASHPEEGHAFLQEGSQVEDLLVRRAVVFGLARIDEPWSTQLLERMQIEDSQWVVRNAAGEVLELRAKPKHNAPRPLPELHQTPWLIHFASELNMGIAPGQTSWDMLFRSLREGNEDQRIAALERYRLTPSRAATVISTIYSILYGPEGETREAAFNTLWHVSAAGVGLPSPAQFGLG